MNICINHHGKISQKHFCKHSTLLINCWLACRESLILSGCVTHGSCYATWWTLASVPSSSPLPCVCTHCHVPITVIPHWKLLPSWDACWESDQFFPTPIQTPAILWKMPSIPNCSHKDLEQAGWRQSCGCWRRLISGGRRVYPAKQKMTLCPMKRKARFGDAGSRGKWNEIKGKKMPRKNGVSENVQAVSSKIKTRSKQVTDREEGPQEVTLLVEVLRKTELNCVNSDSSVKLMRSVWHA